MRINITIEATSEEIKQLFESTTKSPLSDKILTKVAESISTPEVGKTSLDSTKPGTPVPVKKLDEPMCMDEAGKPTLFKNRCSICGELGRNARSHRDTMVNNTHHWVQLYE